MEQADTAAARTRRWDRSARRPAQSQPASGLSRQASSSGRLCGSTPSGASPWVEIGLAWARLGITRQELQHGVRRARPVLAGTVGAPPRPLRRPRSATLVGICFRSAGKYSCAACSRVLAFERDQALNSGSCPAPWSIVIAQMTMPPGVRLDHPGPAAHGGCHALLVEGARAAAARFPGVAENRPTSIRNRPVGSGSAG